MKQLFIFIFLITHFGLLGEVSITFDELERAQLFQEISIRGFPYVGQDGVIYLSTEPNLKSCCVGALTKRGSQIALEGISEIQMKPGHVIAVSGQLTSEGEGETPRYILKNSKVVSNPSSNNALVLVGGIITACFIGFLFRLKK